MAKKGTSKAKRSGKPLLIRASDEDVPMLRRAAKLDGFTSVNQWMLVMARRRALELLLSDDDVESLRLWLERSTAK